MEPDPGRCERSWGEQNAVTKKIKVLAVDDHPAFTRRNRGRYRRRGRYRTFCRSDQRAGSYRTLSGPSARRHADGLADARYERHRRDHRNRREFPDARFIVLTTYQGDVQALRALKAGAAGYLLKNMLRKELLDTIRIVHSGRRRIPPEIAAELADHVTEDALRTVRSTSCDWSPPATPTR